VLSRRLNPNCSAPFRYLREGRLFNLEVPVSSTQPGPGRRLERFWLCGECSSTLTVVLKGTAVLLRPRFRDLSTGERVEEFEEERPFFA
jgi:hypothetical protein